MMMMMMMMMMLLLLMLLLLLMMMMMEMSFGRGESTYGASCSASCKHGDAMYQQLLT